MGPQDWLQSRIPVLIFLAGMLNILQPSDFDQLNLIHVAGTKGKGSTSAFISSVLCQYIGTPSYRSKPLQKVGLYTSPHLRFVRERIQINGQPLSEDQFARYFFEVWDRLEASAKAAGESIDTRAKPVYFRYLTLMAFHTYVSEGVDAAVIECGIGGEYDSTNIIVKPKVTVITSLGIDHTAMLGDTIEQIAWHKAGIMKKGTKCFTVPQPDGAMQVLKDRASERGVDLQVANTIPDIATGTIKLGLNADFQKINASAAVAVAQDFLLQVGYETAAENVLPEKIIRGLRNVQWGGRCETRREGRISWCIDGGHTLESIRLVGQWFSTQIQNRNEGPQQRVLIFNQAKRDANALARTLHETLAAAVGDEKPFDHVIFCSNITFKEAGYRADLFNAQSTTAPQDELSVQRALASTWDEIDPGSNVHVVRTIEEAIEVARGIAHKYEQSAVTTLVTGSLHLVGGFLEVLESSK